MNASFQVSIASAQPFDSGMLHCVLPNGSRNSIKLVVHGRYQNIQLEMNTLKLQKTNVHSRQACRACRLICLVPRCSSEQLLSSHAPPDTSLKEI